MRGHYTVHQGRRLYDDALLWFDFVEAEFSDMTIGGSLRLIELTDLDIGI